jgi:glyoxylase-like metal-dependent hydrolase (beta-lactamase superfamily II)
MRQIARDVFHIPVLPRNGVNTYVIGDVLVDTGYPISAGPIKKALGSRRIAAIALTHAHPDHQGAARKLADAFGVPVWVGANDRDAAESGRIVTSPALQRPGLSRLTEALARMPRVAIARELNEGDELAAGFVVIDTPGHSPGHVSFWRESDRTLLCGDVFFNLHPVTLSVGLRQPPTVLTTDPAMNRKSERRVAELEPTVAGFGHGPVLEGDAAARIAAAVADLPDD